MADFLVTNFTEKERRIAGILLELADLIRRRDRRNHKLIIPSWNAKSKRSLTRRSRRAGAQAPSESRSNSFILRPNFVTTSMPPPSASPSACSERLDDGMLTEVNKNQNKMLASEDLAPSPSPSETPFRIEEEFKAEILMDTKKKSEEVVPLDGDRLKFEFVMEERCCGMSIGKRERGESMAVRTIVKRRRRST